MRARITDPCDRDWQNAKSRGLRYAQDFLQSEWADKNGVREIQLNNEIINKLLKGEIKTLKELKNLWENQLIKYNYNKSLFEYTMLYYSIKEENTDDYKPYVDSIFLN